MDSVRIARCLMPVCLSNNKAGGESNNWKNSGRGWISYLKMGEIYTIFITTPPDFRLFLVSFSFLSVLCFNSTHYY